MPTPSQAALVLIALLGLLTGSFLSVCAYRLPRRLSLAWPGSACPGCGHRLAAWENLPLLGFLLLRGRCRSCRAAIPLRYPLLEIGAAAAFCASYVRCGASLGFVQSSFFLACLLTLVATDWDCRQLPDEITLGGWATGLGLAFGTAPGWRSAWLASLLGGGALWLLQAAYLRWRGRAGMGLGDVKMLGLLGAFLGLRGMFLALLAGSLGGSAAGLGMAGAVGLRRLAQGRGGRRAAASAGVYLARHSLPFGVFLAAGGAAAWLWTQPVWRWWLG